MKAGVRRPIVIPTYSDVPVFIIKNLLRTSGMTEQLERFEQVLSYGM